VTDSAPLGGGYAESEPDPSPTVAAVLEAAKSGSADAHLVVLAGPPGVGKSTVAARLVRLLPNTFWLDKDTTAGGFVLQAAADAGLARAQAYGRPHYFSTLRPLEYAGPMAQACVNLVGARRVILVGGWGPELGVPQLWTGLQQRIAPARLAVIHLDAPPLEAWRQRMAARGSRSDSPWFEQFARSVTHMPIWRGALRVSTDAPAAAVAESVLSSISTSAATR
jgi:energy-coupling factor transporter ATP-binding protein EcfA2